MAEADIAYVAAAGAAGLALSVSAWAWRLRNRLAGRATLIDARIADSQSREALRHGALCAFHDVRIALSPDGPNAGSNSIHGSAEAVAAIEAILFGDTAPGDLVSGLVGAAAAADGRIRALIETGEAFDMVVSGPGGALRAEGRVAGGSA